MPSPFRIALDGFCERVTRQFAALCALDAQAEEQLKGPVAQLIEAVARPHGHGFHALPESRASELGVRPDIGVSRNLLPIGHVELKAPGKGVRRFADVHDREQLKRLSDHPNLVYTDGNEWALHRKGKLVGPVVRADGDVTTDGPAAFGERSAARLEALLEDFLRWEPIVPRSPRALAETLAPLARLLRHAVEAALRDEGSALATLRAEWSDVFFPDADAARFADAYAQTVTYALLLARVEGETDLRARAADRLDARHDLLAQVLRVLAQPAARAEVDVPVSLLERAIGAVDPEALARRARARDVWLYFYEDFLTAYDSKLRRQSGVYYTPVEVVEAQVTLVAELLRERFDLELGFADPGVVVLDPATGTGTYLLAALESGAETAERAFGPAARADRTTVLARNLHGFELLVGAYAVAQLRVAQRVIANGGEIPEDGLPILLADTLESPYAAPPRLAAAPLFERRLALENQRARRVKADTSLLVCLGNPPYFRQVIDPEDEGTVERLGGWVRTDDEGRPGILRDFLTDTEGVHAKNLYNLYVYFWRWALWKVFETGERRGIVSFITASSYVRGPGFTGMRKLMRQLFDELWILDLGGEGRGARRSENVFAIQTPVTIAIGYRADAGEAEMPAHVRYARIEGTREEKLARLAAIRSLDDVDWRDCFAGWTEPFLPVGEGDYFGWPALTDLFPWQHSGPQFIRTWPIAPSAEVLEARWMRLTSSPANERRRLFRESRDRKVSRRYAAIVPRGEMQDSVASLEATSPMPGLVRYAFRSHDRQFALVDSRLGDFLRPPLWRTLSAKQVFLTSFLTEVIGLGPAAVTTHLVPDYHHFRGSFGGKHVMPLWRDAACTEPNVTRGVLDRLSEVLESTVQPEDLLAYCYALLAAPSYTARFAEELEIPGPRVPLTISRELFGRAVSLGRELVWLHTYGERFVPAGHRAGRVPQGAARYVQPIPQTAAGYPERHSYDPSTRELHVGEGAFGPVAPEVRAYEVSGLDVIGSWLDYRMRDGAGRRSSPLDEIRPTVWPETFTTELLELLWVLERTVALGPQLDEVLEALVADPTIPAADLPEPTEEERKAPS